jgi:hypothetical protein
LAEDKDQTLKNLPKNLNSINDAELMKVTQHYGSGRTKKMLKSMYRNKKYHA